MMRANWSTQDDKRSSRKGCRATAEIGARPGDHAHAMIAEMVARC